VRRVSWDVSIAKLITVHSNVLCACKERGTLGGGGVRQVSWDAGVSIAKLITVHS
jgi:hypothetical protein